MPEYRCKIANPDGSIVVRTLLGDSKASLKGQLERQGSFVVDIRREKGIGLLFKSAPAIGRGRMADLITFNQEFAVLLKTGLPVVQALDTIIERRDEGPFTGVLKRAQADIASGQSLAAAFGRHGHVFDDLYITSLQAGEKSGNLPSAITRYTQYQKKMLAIRKKVMSAATYPLILTAASFIVMAILMVYVVPAFTQTYVEADTELPAMTTLLITASNAVRAHYAYLLAVLAMIVVGFFYFRTTETGRMIIDRWKLNLPFLKDLYLSYATAKLTRTLATVLSGGTPLLEAVKISSGSLSNVYLQLNLESVIHRLEEGGGFSDSMLATRVFPKLATRMIAAGESGGALEPVLNEIADFYDDQVDDRLALLATVIEPALMAIMGLLIGFVVVAMYLPIFQLAGTIN